MNYQEKAQQRTIQSLKLIKSLRNHKSTSLDIFQANEIIESTGEPVSQKYHQYIDNTCLCFLMGKEWRQRRLRGKLNHLQVVRDYCGIHHSHIKNSLKSNNSSLIGLVLSLLYTVLVSVLQRNRINRRLDR